MLLYYVAVAWGLCKQMICNFRFKFSFSLKWSSFTWFQAICTVINKCSTWKAKWIWISLMLQKKIILQDSQLCCTLHVFRIYERENTGWQNVPGSGDVFKSLLLLNPRTDSGSFSFYYPLETYSEYYVIKLGKGREPTRQLNKGNANSCASANNSWIICEGKVRQAALT